MAAPALSIIVVSWNVRDLLRACLSSLPWADPAVEVIVVDSASADGTPNMVQTEFPRARLIVSPENLGYSRGGNTGLRAAAGDFRLVLNPDTVVEPGALEAMLAYMRAHPRTGMLGPQLLRPDGSVQPSRRRFPTLVLAMFESTWLEPLAPRAWLEHYYAADLPLDQPVEVDWVVGAALLTRREVWESVGGFDESFFMYSEELDWCRRIRQAGWQVAQLPAARIWHYEGRSSAQVPAATHIRFNSSKVRYFRKHHGPAAAAFLRLWLLKQFAAQWLLEGAKWLLGHKRSLRVERLRIYAEVLRSGLGAVVNG